MRIFYFIISYFFWYGKWRILERLSSDRLWPAFYNYPNIKMVIRWNAAKTDHRDYTERGGGEEAPWMVLNPQPWIYNASSPG